MSTANRTRQSMSFRQFANGNPCAYALSLSLIGDCVGVKARPAVDPDRHGYGEIVT